MAEGGRERVREKGSEGEGEGGGERLRETKSEDGQDTHEGVCFREHDFGVSSLPPSPSCLSRCSVLSRIGDPKSQLLNLNPQISPLRNPTPTSHPRRDKVVF